MWQPTPDEIEEIKLINGEQSVEEDRYYLTMLPILFEHVKEVCNNNFGHREGTQPDIPPGVKIYMAKVIAFNKNKMGLRSRKMGSVSYSYDVEFPNSMDHYIRPYKKVKFHALR